MSDYLGFLSTDPVAFQTNKLTGFHVGSDLNLWRLRGGVSIEVAAGFSRRRWKTTILKQDVLCLVLRFSSNSQETEGRFKNSRPDSSLMGSPRQSATKGAKQSVLLP